MRYRTNQEGVSYEEDGGVVSRQVPVALLGVELHRKPPGITLRVGRARLPGWGLHKQKGPC